MSDTGKGGITVATFGDTPLSVDEILIRKDMLVGAHVFFTTAHFQFIGYIDDIVRIGSTIHIVVGDVKYRKIFSKESWDGWRSDVICVPVREGIDRFWGINNNSKIYIAFRNVNTMMIKPKKKQ